MRITWIVRSFSNYRVPVYKALDELCGHELTVIYYKDAVPILAQKKLESFLGERAIGREKEIRFGNGKKLDNASTMTHPIRIPISLGLVKQVLHTKPEALVSDGFMQWTYAPLLVRAFMRVPHVMCYERTAHTERNANKLRKKYRRFVSRWIDVIDCNGSLCADYVKKLLGWGGNRLTFGHMVADVDGLRENVEKISLDKVELLKKQYNLNGVTFLFVGQLIARKGIKQMLEAWNLFKKMNSGDSTLVIVGSGWQEEELKQYVQLNNVPNVVFVGAIQYESISLFYKASDCFILPTLEDNWSLVIPEAMACGLPVATTIYNGCYPELVKENNGWVFDSLDSKSIINTFDEIVKNKKRLPEMGMISRKIVSSYNAETAAKSIIAAIEKALILINK